VTDSAETIAGHHGALGGLQAFVAAYALTLAALGRSMRATELAGTASTENVRVTSLPARFLFRALGLGVLGASAAIACSHSGSRPTTAPVPPGPPPSASGTATAISAGYGHTCALTSAGGVECWGDNGSGQLGDGTTADRHSPVAVSGLASGVRAIAAGEVLTCAVTSAGGVKCWGYNRYGQLGDGTTADRHSPVAVSGLAGVRAIAAGEALGCALTSAGGVKCWGDNRYGELGDGTTTDHHAPVDVSGLRSGVTAIAVGYLHACALTSAGGVKCWGYNRYGQLGDGTTTDRRTPVDVSGLAGGVTAITAGGGHSCALTRTGGVKCWGSNHLGELGDGTATRQLTPSAVSGLASGVAAIAAGGEAHGCALTSAGAVKCWGYNGYSQLGDGTTVNRHSPVDVSGLPEGVQAIAAGGYGHTCALTSAGEVKCWGRNTSGQLGDGTLTERRTPVGVTLARLPGSD
jgi:alpha-tubulin suppressor-like RCC1 family protein